MKIETKYEVGQHTWVVYADKDTVNVYDDHIAWITVNEEGLYYGLAESCNDIQEEDIVLYDEMDKLAIKIKELMQEIREKKGEEK